MEDRIFLRDLKQLLRQCKPGPYREVCKPPESPILSSFNTNLYFITVCWVGGEWLTTREF